MHCSHFGQFATHPTVLLLMIPTAAFQFPDSKTCFTSLVAFSRRFKVCCAPWNPVCVVPAAAVLPWTALAGPMQRELKHPSKQETQLKHAVIGT